MKKILVTGGAGFIGSNLCEKLIEKNHHVTCVDNLSTGKLDNISKLIKLDNFEFVKHDIIFKFKNQIKFDEIFNLACPASPPSYQKDPIHTLKTCTIGTINMLELALKCNSKILQASTSEVYGDPHVHPQNENYWGNVNTIGYRSCYDEGKRCSETLFMDYNRKYKIDTKIVRIFNTYGPMMDKNDGRVVSNFINQAINSKDITIYGDGNQTRDFIHVADVAHANMMVAEKDIVGVFNVGSGTEYSVNQIASLTNNPHGTTTMPSREGEARRSISDNSKLKNIGWQPRIGLEAWIAKQ